MSPRTTSKETLARIADFVRRLHDTPSEAADFSEESSIFFGEADLGWVWLSGNDALEYLELVSRIHTSLKERASLGRKWVERTLQRAILSALDTAKREESSLDDRIEKSLQELEEELARPPHPWDVYFPIEGLVPPKRPLLIGDVVFRRMSAAAVGRLGAARSVMFEARRTDWSKPRGVAHVKLRGYEGALINETAVRKVVPILDALNFFADIEYHGGHPAILYLPGEAPSGLFTGLHVIGLVGSESGQKKIVAPTFRRTGAVEDFDLARLFSKRAIRGGSKITLKLLRASKRDAMERRILTALQWAGRATAERRLEDALLLYLISLESLVLGPEKDTELGFRLGLGVAHLWPAAPSAQRESIAEEVRHVYKIRGKIVHAGQLGVTQDEVDKARRLAKNAAVAAMRRPELRKLKTEKEVQAWFKRRALR